MEDRHYERLDVLVRYDVPALLESELDWEEIPVVLRAVPEVVDAVTATAALNALDDVAHRIQRTCRRELAAASAVWARYARAVVEGDTALATRLRRRLEH